MTWKRPLFALAALLLFFGITEAVLWAAGVQTLLVERDPFQGFSKVERVYEQDPQRSVYRTVRRATAHSFNYQEFAAQKPAGGFRFFVLGGSSAYGFPWGARVAFTQALATALAASWPHRTVEGVNSAAMSYGSHRLRILAAELLDYQPDLLIVYEGHNEFVERRFYRDVLGRSERLDPFRRLLFRWRLYSALTRLYEKTRESPASNTEPGARSTGELLGFDVTREYTLEVDDAEREQVRGLFEDNLRAIVEMAGRAGVEVVLCTVPSNLSGWIPNQSFFSANVGPDDRRSILALIEDAKAALARHDAAAAAVALKRARLLAPGYAETHFLLGRAYEGLERWDEALEAYRRARDTDGKPSRAPGAFNEAVRRVGEERGGILVDIERAFELASPHRIVGFNLFEDYVHPKPHGHRLIALELWKALQQRGLLGETRSADPAEFWAALGEPAGGEATGDATAPEAATQATTPALLYNLAIVLENQGLVDQAMEKYRACVDLDPGYFVARANLGRLLAQRGRFAEAELEYRGALAVDPRHLNSLIGLGRLLGQAGRADQARELLEQATRVDPRSAPAWDALGGILAQQNLHAGAEAAYRRAAELEPGNAGVLANLGFALLLQNKLDEAQSVFEEGRRLPADDLRCRNGLAAVLTERGRFDEAERLFHESLRLAPDDEFARGGLALIQKRRAAGGRP